MLSNVTFWSILGGLAVGLHLLGFLSAIQAIMKARTPQGSAAWALFLTSFPYLSLPLYWIFGRGRFVGYSVARRKQDTKVDFLRKQEAVAATHPDAGVDPTAMAVFEVLTQMRFRAGNDVRLLIDGTATFDAIFSAIDSAKEYLLIQYYIVREDEVGTLFRDKILAAAKRGVRVSFLFDDIGSSLSRAYLKQMKAASVDIRPFRNLKGPKNRFQLNFRNHRKVVIADGEVAYVGGLNVGDDYLGKYPKIGFWRDTHLELKGPAVAQAQVSFLEDWHWSSDTLPAVRWNLDAASASGKSVLVLPSGPGDALETFTLFLLQAIHSAKRRLWIATPYFVPDIQVVSALQLAALRGVDVRLIVPAKNDSRLCHLAHFSYLKDILPSGIQVFHYDNGFLHQKVMLVDDGFSAVGTANIDNRSFRLNFEITVLVADKDFAAQMEQMLLADLKYCRPVTLAEFAGRSYWFKLAVQVARLFAPVL